MRIAVADRPGEHARPWALVLWALLFIGLPAVIALQSGGRLVPGITRAPHAVTERETASLPHAPPAIEPVRVLDLPPDRARAINAAIPFSTGPNPAARPFRFVGNALARERAIDCLAAAVLYEAGDTAEGQRAVAQVVLNRLRHPAFPKTVCGVVFEGSERVTGCQFTFTCDGALARVPNPAAWARARALATMMLDGAVDRRVGHATHYHTDWVVPYWSGSLDKITAVGTHLFFRWRGWWGTPPAFRRVATPDLEPAIAKLAFLSPAHALLAAQPFGTATVPGEPVRGLAIGPDSVGERFGPGRLAAVNSTGNAFVMLLDKDASPASYETLARQLCAGLANCRMLGWTRASETPSRFPIADDMLAAMSYAYIHMADSNLERSLYNCGEFPNAPLGQCMRQRNPTEAAASVD